MRSLSGWCPWGKSCKDLHCFSRPWSFSPMLSSTVRHSYKTLSYRCPMMGTPFDQGSIQRHWSLYKKTSKIELGMTANSCMMIQSESQNDVYMTDDMAVRNLWFELGCDGAELSRRRRRRESFFSHARTFFDGAKILEKSDQVAAIDFVRKS